MLSGVYIRSNHDVPTTLTELNKDLLPMPAAPWVPVEDVARQLSVAEDSIDRWIEHTALSADKIGRRSTVKLASGPSHDAAFATGAAR